MSEKNNPLQSLIVDDINKEDLDRMTNFLQPYIAFSREGQTHFKSPFGGLDNSRKILVALVAAKAKSLLFDGVDAMSHSDLAALKAMPEGSLKSTLSRLRTDRLVAQNRDSTYFVPSYRLGDVIGS